MARGEDIGEPPLMAVSRHAPTPVQATRRSHHWAREDMTMKLGLAIGYSGAHLDVPVALVQRAEDCSPL
jgi:hypothetical protein